MSPACLLAFGFPGVTQQAVTWASSSHSAGDVLQREPSVLGTEWRDDEQLNEGTAWFSEYSRFWSCPRRQGKAQTPDKLLSHPLLAHKKVSDVNKTCLTAACLSQVSRQPLL